MCARARAQVGVFGVGELRLRANELAVVRDGRVLTGWTDTDMFVSGYYRNFDEKSENPAKHFNYF